MIFGIPKLTPKDKAVIAKLEEARGSLAYLLQVPRRWTGLLRRSTLGRVIRASNTIEGYIIPRDDVVAAAQGESVEAAVPTQLATATYRRAMTHVLGLSKDPDFEWSTAVIKDLHYMMMEYDLDKLPGRWRDGAVYVIDEKGQTVYEGPNWKMVADLMTELVESLASESPDTPGIVQAAMAHLNLVMIHPFKDGNGRMARCLQTLVLGRVGTLEPVFSSIEEYLGKNTGPYYDVLAAVGRGSWHPENEAQPWVQFCLLAHHYQAQTFLRRIREGEAIMGLLEEAVKSRGLPERTWFALWDAAHGYKVRNNTYRAAAEISEAMASRDLMALAKSGLLVPKGEKRGRYYTASEVLTEMRQRVSENRLIPNPYEETPTIQVSMLSTATAPALGSPIVVTGTRSPSSTGPEPLSGQFATAPRRLES
jgi:Fic family protein